MLEWLIHEWASHDPLLRKERLIEGINCNVHYLVV
jgi:hypothetical protein